MSEITCSMCGHTFDSVGNEGCAACPLKKGCQLVRCPQCGFEMVDPNRSGLARAAARMMSGPDKEKKSMIFNWLPRRKAEPAPSVDTAAAPRRLLTELKPGKRARILGFAPRLSAERRSHLQAYGVLPGHTMWVRQHSPVTVIQIDHTELALEADLAATIEVEEI